MSNVKMVEISEEKQQSSIIDFLRFPLIVGVVLIHSKVGNIIMAEDISFGQSLFPIYTVISYVLSDVFSRIAVPLFFMISGFLFFYKTTVFNVQTYTNKLRKRAFTILIPYIFWNLIVLVAFLIAEKILPGLSSGNNKLVSEYSWSDWFWAFWDTSKINSTSGLGESGLPISYQFWFIRDLMIVMLFSPLIYFVIKKFNIWPVFLFGVLWVGDFYFMPIGLTSAALFSFSFGAYFSIHNITFINTLKKWVPYTLLVYLIFTIIIFIYRENNFIVTWGRINVLVGIFLIVGLCGRLLMQRKIRTFSFLSLSSFFIYAYHGIVIVFLKKVLIRYFKPDTDLMMVFIYLVTPLIIIVSGIFLYYLMRKFLPQFTSLITGGR